MTLHTLYGIMHNDESSLTLKKALHQSRCPDVLKNIVSHIANSRIDKSHSISTYIQWIKSVDDVKTIAKHYIKNYMSITSKKPTDQEIFDTIDKKANDLFFPRYAIDRTYLAYDSKTYHNGFILNFDSEVLEVYLGQNSQPNKRGRYTRVIMNSGYYGMELIDEIPFSAIIPKTVQVFNNQLSDLYNVCARRKNYKLLDLGQRL